MALQPYPQLVECEQQWIDLPVVVSLSHEMLVPGYGEGRYFLSQGVVVTKRFAEIQPNSEEPMISIDTQTENSLILRTEDGRYPIIPARFVVSLLAHETAPPMTDGMIDLTQPPSWPRE